MIFRLGRLRKGGAKGPGIFFIIPCIDTYRKVDLRTVSFDVPPQEVSKPFLPTMSSGLSDFTLDYLHKIRLPNSKADVKFTANFKLQTLIFSKKNLMTLKCAHLFANSLYNGCYECIVFCL